MEDRIHCNAEGRVAAIAVMPKFLRQSRHTVGTAIGADSAVRPADPFNMGDTISFGGEFPVNLYYVHGYPLLGHFRVSHQEDFVSREIDYLNLGHSENYFLIFSPAQTPGTGFAGFCA